MDESKWEKWGNYEWEYLAGELEEIRGILYEHIAREDTNGVLYALAEIWDQFGRIHLQDIEVLMMVEELPYTLAAVPRHTLPNDMAPMLPQYPGEEQNITAMIVKYEPECDLDEVYESFHTTWRRNLDMLADAGIAMPKENVSNMFSLN